MGGGISPEYRDLTTREQLMVSDRRKASAMTQEYSARQDYVGKVNGNDGNRIHVIKTDLDLACATRGRTVDVVLDTEEDPIPKQKEVGLETPPYYVYVC